MKLREFRNKHKKSQQEIADAIEVDVTTISKYESGDIKPSLSTMYLIQKYTNGAVLLEDFMNEKKITPRNNKPPMDAVQNQGILA